jgi:hypothetical protein
VLNSSRVRSAKFWVACANAQVELIIIVAAAHSEAHRRIDCSVPM